MSRDTIIFSICSFVLGLIIGSLLIGPKLALRGSPPAAAARTGEVAGAPPNAMDTVRQQIANLNATLARDPNNFDALLQLGNMYMDAAKFPQAIDYFQRALSVREDANVRTDLGICYKQSGEPEKALAAFQQAGREAPEEWQPMYNEAIVLGELRRFDEARALVARLQKMRPGDADVDRLRVALAGK